MHVNCPHCQNPIEVVESADVRDITCPSCGSMVSLAELPTGTTKAPEPPLAKVGKFELVEPLGEGAFGTVWRATDPDMKRDVAVKLPRPGVIGSKGDEERFLREARAAGSLKHDGIVTVHEVGRQDSTVYIISDFVHGVNLAEWLSGRRPDFREAAELMVQIADALGHAHRQGVVHRDMKPSNVMLRLDSGGNITKLATLRPVIMDFGLAKREAREITITREGGHLGTPAYMSPEQARGESHQADARSDVWSLGVMLYELFTGERPFRGQERMLLLQILQDEPKPPRRLNDQIPRDLETITLKCLAKEPVRRYGSASELTEDLRRYLNGEPIQARPVGNTERLWRWAKRMPAVASLAGSVALLLVALVAGSVLFALQQQAAARQLVAKNLELEQANQRERDATKLAEQNADVAREQSQLALKSLQSVIFDIQRKLENIPGAGDLQRSLLQTALARLQEVSDQFAARGAIDRNTHIALIDLGDVFLRIGSSSPRPGTPGRRAGAEGSSDDDSDGPLAAARKVYQQAFDIAQRLAAADPGSVQATRDLAISYNRLGEVQLQSGQVTKAQESYQKGLEISQKLAAADPNSAQAQRDVSISYDKLGAVQLRSGQVTATLEFYQKELEICQKLAAMEPYEPRAQRDLSISYENLGEVQLQSGQLSQALMSYQGSLSIRQKLSEADPSNANARRDLSISYERLGDVQLDTGQVTEAQNSYQQGLQIRQKLSAADPSDVRAQRDLSTSLTKIGDVQFQSGQATEALESFQHCLEIRQKLAAANPNDAQAQRDLYISIEKIGDMQLKSGQATEALESYQKSLVIFERLAATNPNDVQAQRDLVATFGRIASAQQELKQYEQAIESYGRTLKILQSLKEQKRLAPANEKWIGIAERAIQECKHSATALGDWKTLLEQPADSLPVLLEMRGTQFVQEGRASEAIQAVAKLRELGAANANQLYNAACVYSLCAAGIKAKDGELTAEQTAQRQTHIADALETLREAIKAGWKDFSHMQKDSDLTVLRDLPEFETLLPQTDPKNS